MLIIYFSCNKVNTDNSPVKRPDILPSNTVEKPLSSFGSADRVVQTKPAKPNSSPQTNTVYYSCGSNVSGTYAGQGFYSYPSYYFDLSSTSASATVTITCNTYDVPNRFTVYNDSTGAFVGTTGWMGYSTSPGPWGSSLSTPETKSIAFTRGVYPKYRLLVETVTNNTSDGWDASIGCTIPSTITATYAGVSITYEVANNILRFNSTANVDTVLAHLESDYETYNTNYDNQYPNYTADQLDSMDVVNKFDEFKPIRDFEKLFGGYTSKRVKIENIENNWLANNFTGPDPDTADYTYDDYENAVLSGTNYAFKVGTSVYQQKSDGFYINGVLQAGTSESGGGGSARMSCIGGKNKAFYFDNGYTYRLKVALHSIFIRSSGKGKVVAFKSKSGKLRRARSSMAVIAGGKIYNQTGCNYLFQYSDRKPSPSGYKKRKQLETIRRDYYPNIWRTMPGEFAAFFFLPDGFTTDPGIPVN